MRRIFYPLGMATLIGFFAILTAYSTPEFKEIDAWAADKLYGLSWLDSLSILGEDPVLFVVGMGMILYLWFHHRNYRAMLFVFLTVGAGKALNVLLKEALTRGRPPVPQELESYSFPSEHAMGGLLYIFTAAYFITTYMVSEIGKWMVWIAAVGLVAGIGLSRVAGGEHYFSDVLAGWCAGYTLFVAVAIWYEFREHRFEKLQNR